MQQNEIIENSQQDSIDLRLFWRIFTQSKWSIIFITFSCVFIGGIIVKTSTPIYQATSKILADPTPPNAARDEQYISSALVFLFFETQYEIIKSRAVAESVVDQLSLVERYKLEQAENELIQPSLFENLKTSLKSFLKPKSSGTNESNSYNNEQNIRVMLANQIQANLEVSGGKQSQIIHISYESDDPILATDVINSVSQAYIQFGLESRLTEVKATEKWLTEQSEGLRANLKESEEKLKTFRIQQGVVDSQLQQRDSSSRIQSLNNQLITAQSRLGEAKEEFEQIESLAADSKELFSLGAVLSNRIAGDLVKELSKQESKVSELEKRYKDKHPKMISARSELLSIQESLSREIAKIVEQVRRNFSAAQQQVINIENLIAKERESVQALQGSNFTLTSLEREVENNRRIYESFVSKLMETNVRGEFSGSNISIIDYATVPRVPIKPRTTLVVALSLFVGVFLGTVYAVIKYTLNNSVTNTEMIAESLKIQCLGITHSLSKYELKDNPVELKYLQDKRSVFSEGINTVRTAIQFSNIDNAPKTILITSSSASEGKSTLALNLAAAYSQLGKTLLLEVDLRKPSIARNLKLNGKKGLTDVLSNSANLEDTIIKDYQDEQLDILLAGTIPHSPIDILSSDRFKDTLESLKLIYSVIILDGPPTLPVSDTIIVGNNTDVVLMAVKAGSTKISAAKESIKRLTSNNVNVVGGVLTMATPKQLSAYGEHYYSEEYYGEVKITNG